MAYHELNEEQAIASEWLELKNHILEGLQDEWMDFRKGGLERVATQGNRLDHYRKVYRLACEAAHLGDLFIYMPPRPQEPGLCFSDMSLVQTYVDHHLRLWQVYSSP